MKIEIITPDAKLYEGEVKYASFPGTEGSFGVLDNHAPLISTLKSGTIEVTDNNSTKHEFTVKGGVVEVSHNKVVVLAE